jgi:RNA polymerase-binding transcription factor DksA
MMKKKSRKQLETHKTILAKRLKRESANNKESSRLSNFLRFNQGLRQTLLSALARKQMKNVTDAIERIDGGVYGVCVTCGKEIAPKRLDALPTAAHCWDCQHKR